MLSKKRRRGIRQLTAGQMCRFCGKPIADHWLDGATRCKQAKAIYAELTRKKLTSGALYSAFVTQTTRVGGPNHEIS